MQYYFVSFVSKELSHLRQTENFFEPQKADRDAESLLVSFRDFQNSILGLGVHILLEAGVLHRIPKHSFMSLEGLLEVLTYLGRIHRRVLLAQSGADTPSIIFNLVFPV